MKDKLIDYLNENPIGSNGNNTRWLKTRDPILWKWILEQTSFLPEDVKPKQRIWHIINDRYDRPTCPVTGEFVKWHENRYLEHISRSAKSKSDKVIKKRMETYKKKTGFDHWASKENTEGYEKRKKTCLENWGGVWPNATKEVYDKFITTKSANGYCRTDEEKSKLELYMLEVEEYTKNSWYYCYSRINPDGLERGQEYHLDHIYSRKDGFDNGVSPEIIGHWTNLRLMPGKENNGKGPKSDKTLEQLYEDYHNNTRSM